jgi:N-acetyltransferase 10
MPPLLQRLTERKPESLDYLGVSYGLTPQLLRCVVFFDVQSMLGGRWRPTRVTRPPSFDQHTNIAIENRFWKRAGFTPLYLRQTQSELTGEHTCVMVRGLNSSAESDLEWLGEFAKGELDIHKRGYQSNCGWQTLDDASFRYSLSSSESLEV